MEVVGVHQAVKWAECIVYTLKCRRQWKNMKTKRQKSDVEDDGLQNKHWSNTDGENGDSFTRFMYTAHNSFSGRSFTSQLEKQKQPVKEKKQG